MLNTKWPGLVALLFAAHVAWAADPAPFQAPAEAPAGKHMRGPKGILKFGPEVQIQTFANTVSAGANGAQILEGDVRLEITPPAGKHKTIKVLKTPQGEQRTESSDEAPRTLTVKAQKVTMTPQADGGVMLEFENGEIEQH